MIFFDNEMFYFITTNSCVTCSAINTNSTNDNWFVTAKYFIHQENGFDANDWSMSRKKFTAASFGAFFGRVGGFFSGVSRDLSVSIR
jgi:hypothetical protein